MNPARPHLSRFHGRECTVRDRLTDVLVSSSRDDWTFTSPTYVTGNVWGAAQESVGRPVR